MKMWNKKFLAAAVALSAMTGQVYAAEAMNAVEDDTMQTYDLGEVVVHVRSLPTRSTTCTGRWLSLR